MPNKRILLSALLLILSGCAVLQQETATSPAAVEIGEPQQFAALQAAQLNGGWPFQYYRALSNASPAALAEEYDSAKKDLLSNKTAINQWRLAMLHCLPTAPFRDYERAAALFKELTNDAIDQPPDLHDAASLMYTLLHDEIQHSRKAATLADQVAELQAANKTLQDQLDALKAIEHNLSQRKKPEGASKP